MPVLLPPTPVGVPPGHSFWNDWYEKLRQIVNTGAVSVLWANINFSGSSITDLASRAHNNLQSFQGGAAGEYYHLTAAEYAALGTGGGLSYTVNTRTSNSIFSVGDAGKLIVYTSGTFTQTFTAAASLGAGWTVAINNRGTGVITLAANVSETIDGRTTIKVYPGEAFTIVCTGTTFYTLGRSKNVSLPIEFTSTTSYTINHPASDNEIVLVEYSTSYIATNNSAKITQTAISPGNFTITQKIFGVSSFNTTTTLSSILDLGDTNTGETGFITLKVTGMGTANCIMQVDKLGGGDETTNTIARHTGTIQTLVVDYGNPTTFNGSITYHRK